MPVQSDVADDFVIVHSDPCAVFVRWGDEATGVRWPPARVPVMCVHVSEQLYALFQVEDVLRSQHTIRLPDQVHSDQRIASGVVGMARDLFADTGRGATDDTKSRISRFVATGSRRCGA